MKNLFLVPTEKPSRLWFNDLIDSNELILSLTEVESVNNQHIYITNSEEIKEGVNQWYLDKLLNKPRNSSGSQYGEKQNVIILTTDQDLIKDGVQAIDDEFLEWFVKNPSCEFVETKRIEDGKYVDRFPDGSVIEGIYENYKIIIPQEEPKQETLEEAAANLADPNLCKTDNWIAGAKWQSERMYSEEEVLEMLQKWSMYQVDIELNKLNIKELNDVFRKTLSYKEWFEQFKKK